jgi:hypothetical protein
LCWGCENDGGDDNDDDDDDDDDDVEYPVSVLFGGGSCSELCNRARFSHDSPFGSEGMGRGSVLIKPESSEESEAARRVAPSRVGALFNGGQIVSE